MPINTRELMDAVATLTDKENMRVTMKGSAKGAAICGAACFAGGLVAGPVGLAVGGTIGAISAGYMSRGKFRAVGEIIRHDMTEREREKLKDHLVAALSEFHPTDMAVLLPLLMGSAAAQRAVLSTVVSFLKLKPEWNQLVEIMGRFQYFDHWTDEQRQDCQTRAKVREFDPGQTIFVEGRSPVNYAHFVLSGRCMVVQCLKMVKVLDKFGKEGYRLADAQPIEDEITQFHRRRSSRMIELGQSPFMVEGQNFKLSSSTLTAANCLPVEELKRLQSLRPIEYEYRFLDVATFGCGSVFGVGEHMDDRTVVARSRVQCLLIPRYWLLQKPQNQNNVWNRVRVFIEQRQPSRDKLFEWFLSDGRWQRMRTQLREDFAAAHPKTHPTALGDVPRLCRIDQSDVFA
ncbi:hypothetical protein quinque_014606 [Culex quinquefasciatus]